MQLNMLYVGEKTIALAALGAMVITGKDIHARDIYVLLACIIILRDTILDKLGFGVIFFADLFVAYGRIKV